MSIKLGLMGGTFNPVHTGHLLIAESVREQFQLDKILFIPTFIPPHKDYKPDITNSDRLKLLSLGIENNSYFEVSDVEFERKKVSYTIETVNLLYSKYEIKNKLHLIVGCDLIDEFHTWKNVDELISKIELIVVDRGDKRVRDYKKRFPFIKEGYAPLFNVTSTMVREKRKKGLSIKYLVPEKVEQYIIDRELYS